MIERDAHRYNTKREREEKSEGERDLDREISLVQEREQASLARGACFLNTPPQAHLLYW